MLKLTPILVVNEIEPCLPFWMERLGFRSTGTSHSGDRLSSVTLQRDGLELIYRTHEDIRADFPVLAEPGEPRASALAIEVNDIAEFEQALQGADIVVPLRQTSYGGAELAVREPGGHLIIFTARAGY